MLQGPQTVPGSEKALTEFDADVSLVDLDDPSELVALSLAPSRVVTRHRRLTQAWALAIFTARQGNGVKWWSYHDPDWRSVGLWEWASLKTVKTEPLHGRHPALVEARSVMARPWRALT